MMIMMAMIMIIIKALSQLCSGQLIIIIVIVVLIIIIITIITHRFNHPKDFTRINSA